MFDRNIKKQLFVRAVTDEARSSSDPMLPWTRDLWRVQRVPLVGLHMWTLTLLLLNPRFQKQLETRLNQRSRCSFVLKPSGRTSGSSRRTWGALLRYILLSLRLPWPNFGKRAAGGWFWLRRVKRSDQDPCTSLGFVLWRHHCPVGHEPLITYSCGWYVFTCNHLLSRNISSKYF